MPQKKTVYNGYRAIALQWRYSYDCKFITDLGTVLVNEEVCSGSRLLGAGATGIVGMAAKRTRTAFYKCGRENLGGASGFVPRRERGCRSFSSSCVWHFDQRVAETIIET